MDHESEINIYTKKNQSIYTNTHIYKCVNTYILLHRNSLHTYIIIMAMKFICHNLYTYVITPQKLMSAVLKFNKKYIKFDPTRDNIFKILITETLNC